MDNTGENTHYTKAEAVATKLVQGSLCNPFYIYEKRKKMLYKTSTC